MLEVVCRSEAGQLTWITGHLPSVPGSRYSKNFDRSCFRSTFYFSSKKCAETGVRTSRCCFCRCCIVPKTQTQIKREREREKKDKVIANTYKWRPAQSGVRSNTNIAKQAKWRTNQSAVVSSIAATAPKARGSTNCRQSTTTTTKAYYA